MGAFAPWVRLLRVCCIFVCLAQFATSQYPSEKTKLCADADCKVPLFAGKVVRKEPSTHPDMIDLSEIGANVLVYGIEFSDRLDLWDGETEAKMRGIFYKGHIQQDGFLEFLRSAVKTDKEFFVVPQERPTGGRKGPVERVSAAKALGKRLEIIENELKEASDASETPPQIPQPPASPLRRPKAPVETKASAHKAEPIDKDSTEKQAAPRDNQSRLRAATPKQVPTVTPQQVNRQQENEITAPEQAEEQPAHTHPPKPESGMPKQMPKQPEPIATPATYVPDAELIKQLHLFFKGEKFSKTEIMDAQQNLAIAKSREEWIILFEEIKVGRKQFTEQLAKEEAEQAAPTDKRLTVDATVVTESPTRFNRGQIDQPATVTPSPDEQAKMTTISPSQSMELPTATVPPAGPVIGGLEPVIDSSPTIATGTANISPDPVDQVFAELSSVKLDAKEEVSVKEIPKAEDDGKTTAAKAHPLNEVEGVGTGKEETEKKQTEQSPAVPSRVEPLPNGTEQQPEPEADPVPAGHELRNDDNIPPALTNVLSSEPKLSQIANQEPPQKPTEPHTSQEIHGNDDIQLVKQARQESAEQPEPQQLATSSDESEREWVAKHMSEVQIEKDKPLQPPHSHDHSTGGSHGNPERVTPPSPAQQHTETRDDVGQMPQQQQADHQHHLATHDHSSGGSHGNPERVTPPAQQHPELRGDAGKMPPQHQADHEHYIPTQDHSSGGKHGNPEYVTPPASAQPAQQHTEIRDDVGQVPHQHQADHDDQNHLSTHDHSTGGSHANAGQHQPIQPLAPAQQHTEIRDEFGEEYCIHGTCDDLDVHQPTANDPEYGHANDQPAIHSGMPQDPQDHGHSHRHETSTDHQHVAQLPSSTTVSPNMHTTDHGDLHQQPADHVSHHGHSHGHSHSHGHAHQHTETASHQPSEHAHQNMQQQPDAHSSSSHEQRHTQQQQQPEPHEKVLHEQSHDHMQQQNDSPSHQPEPDHSHHHDHGHTSIDVQDHSRSQTGGHSHAPHSHGHDDHAGDHAHTPHGETVISPTEPAGVTKSAQFFVALSWVRDLFHPLILLLRRLLMAVRTVLPGEMAAGIEKIDDLGLFMIILTLASTFVYLIGYLFRSSSLSSDQLDRRAFANTFAGNKALKAENEKLKLVVADGQKHDETSKQQLEDLLKDNQELQKQERQMHAELDDLKTQLSDMDSILQSTAQRQKDATAAADKANEELQKANESAKELQRTNRELDEQLREFRANCESAREKAQRFEDEAIHALAEAKMLDAEKRILETKTAELDTELDHSRREAKAFTEQIADLEEQLSGMRSLVEDLQRSQGTDQEDLDKNDWSDVGDWEDKSKPTGTSRRGSGGAPSSPRELVDAAKLRNQLKIKDEQLRSVQREKERLTAANADGDERLADVKRQLQEMRAKADAAEGERRDLVAQNRQCMSMMEAKDGECGRQHAELAAARDQLAQLDADAREQKRAALRLEQTVAERDRQLTDAQRAEQKLRMAHFHEVKKLNDRLSSMSMQVNEMGMGAARHRYDAMSNYAPLPPTDAALMLANGPAAAAFDSAGWADLPPLAPFALGSDESFDGADGGRPSSARDAGRSARSTRARSRNRATDSPAAAPARRSTDERRQRSRSRGRVGGGGGGGGLIDLAMSPTSFDSGRARYDNAHYFSSPGSASGPSPPPQMPLVEGVAPAGLLKPSPTKQMHRR